MTSWRTPERLDCSMSLTISTAKQLLWRLTSPYPHSGSLERQSKSFFGGANSKLFAVRADLSTSDQLCRHGHKSGKSGLNALNPKIRNKTVTLSDSIGQCGTNGCHRTIGQIW
jgi:hypothetical protein